MSTPRLLRMSTTAHSIHADGTYKIVIENHPLLGRIDRPLMSFYLIGLALSTHERADDYTFLFDSAQQGVAEKAIVPHVLICDSAAAIQNDYTQKSWIV